ncbi:hypothetical protein NE848_16520 [Gramella jeungdoensis]|uniref:Uncharacterized protein n=1 Tax=Gramella jeungdoensis TaxID=708091 RepID=A0ABT0Z8C8_9FLAO|nr:hypothetical protein [Gramella jeungdoensis]MCM8571004.1 hypothetical protein [Gramella jeungdoensis]
MDLRLLILVILLILPARLNSQKKLQRPSGGIGIESIDSVVANSFNIYDYIFDYKMRMEAGEILNEEEMCRIEEFSVHSEILEKNAIKVSSYLDTESFLTRVKGTIQLQRAKRVLAYCRQTSNEIMIKQNANN